MSNSIDVFVQDGDGDPVAGKRVRITIKGFLSGGAIEEFTDDEGHAEFETAGDYEDSREFWIRVGDELWGPYEIGGGAFTVELGTGD